MLPMQNMQNSKGNVVIIVAIVIFIALLLYFAFFNPDAFSKKDTGAENGSFLENAQSKLPPSKLANTVTEITEDTNAFNIYLKIELTNNIGITDKNVEIIGKPELMFGEKKFILANPQLIGFSGTASGKEVIGTVNTILAQESILETKSDFTLNISAGFSEIIIPDMIMNLESFDNTGTLKAKDNEYPLNKSYLKIEDFSGKVTIKIEDEKPFLILEGNVARLKFIANQVTTLIE